MKHELAAALAALSLWPGVTGLLSAQQPPPPEAVRLTPLELFEQARQEIAVGRFDTAGETLKRFLASNPTDEDYRAITDREPTAFQRLRFNIPVWSENPVANAEYKEVIAQLQRASDEANRKFLRDPARVARFVRNLSATDEERIFAEQQLRLAGDAVVVPLVEAIQKAIDPFELRRLTEALTRLDPGQLPGVLASATAFDPSTQLAVVRALADRDDLPALAASPDTDIRPLLWYYVESRGLEAQSLRAAAGGVLDRLAPGARDRTSGARELVRLTRPLADGQADYRGWEPVALWVYDDAQQRPTVRPATKRQANDFYAVRNLRWALERNPGNAEAIELFLTVAIERAVEGAQFGDLLQADPALVEVFAGAKSETLNALLNQAIDAKRTALALGLTQILSARMDKAASGAFVRGLDYPDHRVQLAAAVGLLKVPGSVPAGRTARVVDILRRAAAVDATPDGKLELGRAIVVDPSSQRGDQLARHLTDLGYRAERLATGRQLAARIRRADDADMIFVDRHVVDPVLPDLITAVSADLNTASRPVFIVASDDYALPVSFNRLLLRLATLVAVADLTDAAPPAPFKYDAIRRLRPEEVEAERAKIVTSRDIVLRQLYAKRLDQLERLVGGAGLPPSQTLRAYLDTRLPQLTLATLAAQYPVSPESAPETARLLAARTRTLELNPQLENATIGLDVNRLARIVEDLDAILTPAQRDVFEAQLARSDNGRLLIPAEPTVAPEVVDRINRLAATVPNAKVIPSPSSKLGLEDQISAVLADPERAPVPASVKRANARLAVQYLKRMAVGEITGFDVRPAEPALRSALRDDELAPLAAEAVARFNSAEAQQDLVSVALSIARPVELRLLAADKAIQHVETFGRRLTGPQIDAIRTTAAGEKNPELRGKMLLLMQMASPRPANLSELVTRYPLPLPPEAPKDAAKIEPKDAPAPKPVPDGGR